MTAKNLLTYALAMMSANDLNKLLEESRLEFLVDRQWYEFKEGGLRSVESGSPAASPNVKQVKLKEIAMKQEEGPVSMGGPKASDGVKERAGGATIKDGTAVGQGAPANPDATTVGGDTLKAPETQEKAAVAGHGTSAQSTGATGGTSGPGATK